MHKFGSGGRRGEKKKVGKAPPKEKRTPKKPTILEFAKKKNY